VRRVLKWHLFKLSMKKNYVQMQITTIAATTIAVAVIARLNALAIVSMTAALSHAVKITAVAVIAR